MKNNRFSKLIESAAGRAGIPDSLIKDIVPLAQRHLKTAGHGPKPQHRDVVWAVDLARREWSRRFLAALDARGARPEAA